MSNKRRHFADDGWAIWVDGDDTSTVYINDWLNPKGKSYVDIAVRMEGVKASRALYVYVPFKVEREEIEDVSLKFEDRNILKAVFSNAPIIDYRKNEYTSEIAYNGKTVDVLHVASLDLALKPVADGTLITIDFSSVSEFIDNDEIYTIWRMPHKSLDEVFHKSFNVGNLLERFRDLLTTPVRNEKYGYSIRINEARLLPDEIGRIGAFHRQRLRKAVIVISLSEEYDITDSGCYRIHRLEENLYAGYLPKDYSTSDVISYQWNQTRDDNSRGHFNFYFNIMKESVSRASMVIYLILLLLLGASGDAVYDLLCNLIGLIF